MHLPLWVELLVGSAVLLGRAEILRRCSRRLSPAARHKLLLWAFELLAFWPVLYVLLPELRFPLLAAPDTRANVRAMQTSFVRGHAATKAAVNWPLYIWSAGVIVALLPPVWDGS